MDLMNREAVQRTMDGLETEIALAGGFAAFDALPRAERRRLERGHMVIVNG